MQMNGWGVTGLETAAFFAAMAVAAGCPANSPKTIKAGDVSEARVIAESSNGSNWLVNGGNFGSQHFSPLGRVTERNVGDLGLAWYLDVDSPMGMASEPIVVDGTIYVTASLDRVMAVNAVSGKVLWTYDPHVRLTVMRNSWAARTNRGVAVWEGKVFVGTGDCRLIALDASTGKQLWDSPVCVDDTQTGITGAPRVGNGKVFIGYNGSDTGVRGSLVALDANNGKLAWRFWNVPGNPSKGFDNNALAMAAKTWSGEKWWTVGGGDVWDTITYDQATIVVPPVPKPPAQTASAAIVHRGEEAFSKFMCDDCHSPQADGSGAWVVDGAIPDLRYMPTQVHAEFPGIVLAGSHRNNGMPSFGTGAGFPMVETKMSVEDANAIHAYIIDLSWKAYNADRARLQSAKGPP
jgi:glucose dehydrogenase